MVPFLSPAWFERALDQAQRIDGDRPELACRLQFVAESAAGPVRWMQVISAGLITDWRLGECEEADIEVRLSLEHAWRIWRGDVDGNEALAAITVAEDRPSGRWTGPPAPLDLGEQAALADLAHLPGVTLDVHYEYGRGPFGPIDFALSIVDGQVDAMSLQPMPEPDVRVRATFLQMARVRRGDVTILEVLAEGTTLEGAEGALALLAGISESPEFHGAELACGRSGVALGVLGEVTADPSYQEALAPLADGTGPPDGS